MAAPEAQHLAPEATSPAHGGVVDGPVSELKDVEIDPEANDGQIFFTAVRHITDEATSLTPFDIAGGMRNLSSYFKELGRANLQHGTEAIKKLDYSHGWAGFKESAQGNEIIKAPVGAAQFFASLVLFVLFAAIFYPAKYGPGIVKQVKDKAIRPALEKAAPLWDQGKEKLSQLMQQRSGGSAAADQAGSVPEELEQA